MVKELGEQYPDLENEIVAVVETGNVLNERNKHEEALVHYEKAWSMLPDPKLGWEIASWIASCFYHSYFEMKKYDLAKGWAQISLETRGSSIDTAPLIDLGMVCYELAQYDEAYGYFDEAYRFGKQRAFQERPKKYLDFYRSKG